MKYILIKEQKESYFKKMPDGFGVIVCCFFFGILSVMIIKVIYGLITGIGFFGSDFGNFFIWVFILTLVFSALILTEEMRKIEREEEVIELIKKKKCQKPK